MTTSEYLIELARNNTDYSFVISHQYFINYIKNIDIYNIYYHPDLETDLFYIKYKPSGAELGDARNAFKISISEIKKQFKKLQALINFK